MLRRRFLSLGLLLVACAEGQGDRDLDALPAAPLDADDAASLDADDAAPAPDALARDDTAPAPDALARDDAAPAPDALARDDVAPALDIVARDDPPAARCGDGVIDRATGEVCDDGNTADDDDCAGDCRSVRCTGGSRQHVDPSTHACYWRDPTIVSRAGAVARCRGARAELAMFETPQELSSVYPTMGLGGSNRVWIGLQRGATAWAWDNGAGLAYTGFRRGEPSGDGPCAEWGPGNDFNDIGCGNTRDFVCERPAPGRVR